MLAMPSFLAPTAVGAGLLNKLLAREEWAGRRLSRHAGKSVRFVVGGATAAFTIQSDGLVQACDVAILPDVILTIPADKLGRLPAALGKKDPDLIAALMHVQGDAALASVVSELARELRWDIEDDLAGLVGDVAALRLIKGVKTVFDRTRTSTGRFAGNVGEYLSEEGKLVLGRDAYESWRDRLGGMRERLDSLEQRVQRLDANRPSSRTEGEG